MSAERRHGLGGHLTIWLTLANSQIRLVVFSQGLRSDVCIAVRLTAGNGQMSLSQFQHLMAAQQQQQQAFAVPVHHGNGVPPMNHTNGGMPAAPLRMLDLPEFR